MSKKKPEEVSKPLTREEVANFKPVDETAKLQEIMGLSLESIFKVAIENGASVVPQVAELNKAANVDKMPEAPKPKEKKK